jgi:large conductance mechanosensitive channel
VVDDIIMPIMGAILGGVDITSLSVQLGDAMINHGSFIQAIVIFMIIALVLFLVVRSYNRLKIAEGKTDAHGCPA